MIFILSLLHVANIARLTCDYMGRKVAIVLTTGMIILGLILSAAAHGVTISGMFWMLTIARGRSILRAAVG